MPERFYGLEEGSWFTWTGETRPSGYDYPASDRFWPVYRRESDGAVGWFPGVGRRFTTNMEPANA